MVLRIVADDSQSVCKFNAKFGAHEASHAALLAAVRREGLEFAGVSFHVGSGCGSAEPFRDAVGRARRVFDAATAMGMSPRLLDVGGGFPGEGSSAVSFAEIAAALRAGLVEHFADFEGLRVRDAAHSSRGPNSPSRRR